MHNDNMIEGVLITEHSHWNIKQKIRMLLGEEHGSGQGNGNKRVYTGTVKTYD